MSKDIDFSQPLSEEDAAYVADRPWLAVDAKLSGFDLVSEEDFVVDESGDDPDETSGESSEFEDVGGDDENSEESDEDDESETDEVADEDGEEGVAPYEEWDYASLKEEAGSRNLSKSGSKEQLIERLEQDDATAESE